MHCLYVINFSQIVDFKKLTFLQQQKPKCHFFSTALTAQLRVNQNKQNGQTFCEKVKGQTSTWQRTFL